MRTKHVNELALTLVTFILITIIANPLQAAPIVLKMGTVEPPMNAISLAGERLTKLVDEKSNGRLKVQLFPASQLGNFTTQIEAVMMGGQDMFLGAAENLGQFEKDYNILSMGFAFRDQKHLQAFFRSPINAEIRERLRTNRGMRSIAENWDRSPRVLLSKKPVGTPKDLQGIKMRVPEIEMYLKVWKALGTQPTQVAWGETYLALMQGVVDAMEGPFDTLLGMKFFEAAPNISLTNHLIVAANLSMNDKRFLSLPKDLQEILLGAANEAGDYFAKSCIDGFDRDKNAMEAKGAKFITVDRKAFQEKLSPLVSEMEEKGMWSKGLYQKVQDLK